MAEKDVTWCNYCNDIITKYWICHSCGIIICDICKNLEGCDCYEPDWELKSTDEEYK